MISSKSNSKKRIAAALAAAAICMTFAFSGCGKKTDNSSEVESVVISATTDVASSSEKETEASSKTESKAESKTESKESTSSKAASSKASSASGSSSKAAEASKVESDAETTENQIEVTTSAAETTNNSSAAPKTDGYKKDQVVTVYVNFGHIAMNGEPAKIAAYDYWITYNSDLLEFVSADQMTSSDLKVVNSNEPGMVKIAHIAAYGFDDDFTGEAKPTYKVQFKVKQDTKDLGLSGKCPSLTACTMDGKDTLTLISVKQPNDPYSSFTVEAE